MSGNKDYIINLRVSRATYQKIKKKAKENSDTMSSLIRKMIEDGGEVMRDLSSDIFGKQDKRAFDDIVGYHGVVLAREMECDGCGGILKAGSAISAGETASGKRFYFCGSCAE